MTYEEAKHCYEQAKKEVRAARSAQDPNRYKLALQAYDQALADWTSAQAGPARLRS